MAPHVKVTPELRKEVVSLKASGLSLSAISRKVNRSKSVISRILKLFDKNKTFCPTSKANYHKTRRYRTMKRFVEKDPFETASGISCKMKKDFDKDVSIFTISRRPNNFGLKACRPATKPSISKKKEGRKNYL